jgi:hypothetical protein
VTLVHQNEYTDRQTSEQRPRPPIRVDPGGAVDHPLLDLQQQAGNAAVSRLVALQRHTLNPEEEAG